MHQIELFGTERCQSAGYIKSSFLGQKDAYLQDTSNRAFWDRKMPMSCRTDQIELAGYIKSSFLGQKDANAMQDA